MSEPLTILSFNGRPVASLTGIFEHQGTWFADYTLPPDLPARLMEFVAFNRHRLSVAEFDDAELNSYADFCEGDLWQIDGPEGKRSLDGPPLFSESDVCWIYPESSESGS